MAKIRYLERTIKCTSAHCKIADMTNGVIRDGVVELTGVYSDPAKFKAAANAAHEDQVLQVGDMSTVLKKYRIAEDVFIANAEEVSCNV